MTGRVRCPEPGCGGKIEAYVPLCLDAYDDGSWKIKYVLDDVVKIVCDDAGHEVNTWGMVEMLFADLGCVLRDVFDDATYGSVTA